MQSSAQDRIIVGALSLLFIGISFLGWLILGEVVLIFCLGIMMGLLIIIQIENYRRTQQLFQRQEFLTHSQLESLFSIYSLLNINYPLPPMRGHAISPEFANILMSTIYEQKPELVVEAGSGVSTLIAAYSLKRLGAGTVISLEHHEKFLEIGTGNLKKHGLQDIATIVYAPLKEVAVRDGKWLWYDTAQLKKLKSIDMLIVDGPPAGTQKLARYPALPILFNLLSDDAVVILDDGFRKDEKKILDLWLEEFDCFESKVFNSGKGIVILRRK